MNRFKKLVVPIGLLGKDAGAIAWASQVAGLAHTESVTFLHVYDVPEIPQKAVEKYAWLAEPLDGPLMEKMKELVEQHWTGCDEVKLEFKVIAQKSPLFGLLSTIQEQDADLVVIGKMAFGADMAVHLARKASCSVMSVPNDSAVKLDAILVPTDFSNYSRTALDVSLAFAKAARVASVDSLHVFSLGRLAHRATLPQDELIALGRETAIEKHAAFVKEVDADGVDIQLHDYRGESVSTSVVRACHSFDTDLIVTSCRGKNAMTAWLLGSNAEELLRLAPVPVIAAKVKGAGQGLLSALLGE